MENYSSGILFVGKQAAMNNCRWISVKKEEKYGRLVCLMLE